MGFEDQHCVKGFVRLCNDGFAQGWHEANGGNLSYRMTSAEREGFTSCVGAAGQTNAAAQMGSAGKWQPLGAIAPDMAGECLLITRSGAFLHNVELDFAENVGIVEIGPEGDCWCSVWGFGGDGSPSSELAAHVMIHETRMRATNDACRVVYHAHCPNVIALSTLIAAQEPVWTRALWKCMTECIIVFPQGIGVLPWIVPGSVELARATCERMETYPACIWTQHGVIASGASFDEAFGCVHTIEKAAGLYLQALGANGGREPKYLVSDEHLRQTCEWYGLSCNESFLFEHPADV